MAQLTWVVTSHNESETINIGESLGSQCRGGECIVLTSDVGGGKTTFVRGFAKGCGSLDEVHSPSFTIANEYRTGSKTIYHFDFYRLNDPGIMLSELSEVIEDPHNVVIIEWADIVSEVLPVDHVTITFTNVAEQERKISVQLPSRLQYLKFHKT